MANSPKISVITVCLNAADCIRDTMESVTSQSYPNVEHILIDGISTDGTLEILADYQNRISRLVSEKDSGIYDAMNKGLRLSTGDFVIFMNAGDTFAGPTVLSDLEPLLSNADLVYGDTLLIDEDGNEIGLRSEKTPHKLPSELSLDSFRHGLPFCHQSVIARRSICPAYNTKYRVSADTDWMIRVSKASSQTKRFSNPISHFRTGGFSNTNWSLSQRERFSILAEHFGLASTLASHCYIVFRRLRHVLLGGELR